MTSRGPLRGRDFAAIAAAALVLCAAGSGGSTRLSYHEAIVAQGAREMLAAGARLVPTLDGRPWLEKPPLLHWLVMATARAVDGGRVTEWSARLPSGVAAAGLACAVAAIAARRFGRRTGRLAGLIQATTAWAVLRGRLAEADMLLAMLIAAALWAFDRLRDDAANVRELRMRRLAFFALLGATALAKGIVFGGVLVTATVLVVLLVERDGRAARRLCDPPGWCVAALIASAWPLADRKSVV